MKHRDTVRRFLNGLRKSVHLFVICVAAVLSAAILSILFTGAVVTQDVEEADLTAGDFAVAWKPAYLFSVPQEGDAVLYAEETASLKNGNLQAAKYDEDEIALERVRGKVIFKIPAAFVPGGA